MSMGNQSLQSHQPDQTNKSNSVDKAETKDKNFYTEHGLTPEYCAKHPADAEHLANVFYEREQRGRSPWPYPDSRIVFVPGHGYVDSYAYPWVLQDNGVNK